MFEGDHPAGQCGSTNNLIMVNISSGAKVQNVHLWAQFVQAHKISDLIIKSYLFLGFGFFIVLFAHSEMEKKDFFSFL